MKNETVKYLCQQEMVERTVMIIIGAFFVTI